MSSTVFCELISTYPTWAALSTYLKSAEGGALRVDDFSTPENPFAVIRYMKGRSDMTIPHVRSFRSVVWDTLENRPASVTSFKSHTGETLPTDRSVTDFELEYFMDGVMIGMFWDKYNNMWRIHTRSTLDARCRYFSQTKTFATMFSEAIGEYRETMEKSLNTNTSYTWILQHPENRIVVPVKSPRVYCVQAVNLMSNGGVTITAVPEAAFPAPKVALAAPTWDKIRDLLVDWNRRFSHGIQGLVAKAGFDRYKVRTTGYNVVRRRRGNSARRDFLWLSEWRAGTLPAYLAVFPEERDMANTMIARWKQATNDVYHWYVSIFKARDTPKHHIPPKYRPLVYGLHNEYMNTLKPAGKSVDWKACLGYMNNRDTAQMLFVMNWDLRQTAQRLGVGAIPLEPPATTTESQVDGEEVSASTPSLATAAAAVVDSAAVADTAVGVRPGTPSEVAPVTDTGSSEDVSASAPGGD